MAHACLLVQSVWNTEVKSHRANVTVKAVRLAVSEIKEGFSFVHVLPVSPC